MSTFDEALDDLAGDGDESVFGDPEEGLDEAADLLVDDRDQQGTLDVGEGAARTADRQTRESQAGGSESFFDMADESGTDERMQSGLLEQETTLEDQASLTGGQASVTEGQEFLDGPDEADAGDPVAEVADELAAERQRPVPEPEADPDADLTRRASEADVSLAPDEALRGVGTGETSLSDGTAVGSEDQETDLDEPEDLIADDLAQARQVETGQAAAEAAGVLDPDPPSSSPSGGSVPVEFETLAGANEFRDRRPDALASDDTRREKTVRLKPGADQDIRRDAELAALRSGADDHMKTTADPTILSDAEKKQLKRRDNFSWQEHAFEAAKAKSRAQASGVSDWLDLYEPNEGAGGALSRLERQKEMEARTGAGTALRGDRFDDEDSTMQTGRKAERYRGQREERAREAARDGVEDAVNALIEDFGYDPAEARALGDAVRDPASPMTEQRLRRIVEIERQKANGRFVSTPTDRTANSETDRSRTNGRYVDDDRERIDPPIKRSAETGRFVAVDGGE